jgi:hypothetical protein
VVVKILKVNLGIGNDKPPLDYEQLRPLYDLLEMPDLHLHRLTFRTKLNKMIYYQVKD